MSSVDDYSGMEDVSVNNKNGIEDNDDIDNKSNELRKSNGFQKLIFVKEENFDVVSTRENNNNNYTQNEDMNKSTNRNVTFGNMDNISSPKNNFNSGKGIKDVLHSINQDLDQLTQRIDSTILGKNFYNHTNNYGSSLIVNNEIQSKPKIESNDIDSLRKSNQIKIDELNNLLNKGLYDDYDSNINSGFNQSFTNHKREKSNASILYNGNSYAQTNIFP